MFALEVVLRLTLNKLSLQGSLICRANMLGATFIHGKMMNAKLHD